MAKKKPHIKADATAKLEASAKASFQRKVNVTQVIPPDVTRAKAGAWLDLISPISEWAGLRGDQLRHKRQLLRIQQETVLTKIVERARRMMGIQINSTSPVPNKFLVPFLEKASLEESDSELIDTWASLLSSAATSFDPHMVRFCTILSEVGPMEVQFLHRLCREARGKFRNLSVIEDAPLLFSTADISRMVNRAIKATNSAPENLKSIIGEHEIPGGLFLVLGVSLGEDASSEEIHPLDNAKWESSISLLQSLGLVENQMFVTGEAGPFSWYCETVSLTSFGVAFVKACDPEIGVRTREQRA
jgi:hypothetical protein